MRVTFDQAMKQDANFFLSTNYILLPGHTVTSISLEGVSITADGLSPLRNLPNLKILRVGWSKGVADEALAPIAGMSSLEELLIAGNKEIRGPGLSHLTGLKNLRTLASGHDCPG